MIVLAMIVFSVAAPKTADACALNVLHERLSTGIPNTYAGFEEAWEVVNYTCPEYYNPWRYQFRMWAQNTAASCSIDGWDVYAECNWEIWINQLRQVVSTLAGGFSNAPIRGPSAIEANERNGWFWRVA